MYAILALAVIPAYLLGSIPFGVIIAKAKGKDLRSIGSGNIGATNVARALGRRWAYFCAWPQC
ncbi:MAG: glycerol-3-phosphate acyltransferase [Planctomycetota bacterium]|jgi:glycerol-3-phosphate acyltransferase PlsY